MRARLALIAVLAVSACGQPSGSGDPDAAIDDGDGSATDGGDNWTMLIQRSWSTIANSEQYRCRSQMVTEDLYITGFRALSPPGTHHEMVTIPVDQTVKGDFNCSAADITGSSTMQLLYAGGFGTNDFVFPAGVAIKIPAGTVIQLYLHVANFTDQSISETSGILVQTVPASQVVHEAEMRFFGKATFEIPATGQPYTESSSCGATGSDWHIVGMWPHMHTIATHQKIEIQHFGVTMKTPLDADYNFLEQKSYAMDFVVPVNDRVAVTCTWVNDTGSPVGSGDSAAAEMCYAGAFMYPKLGSPYACVQ